MLKYNEPQLGFCRVGVKLPTVEVRCKNLRVEAECQVVHGKPLPTLWNSVKSTVSVSTLTVVKCHFDH